MKKALFNKVSSRSVSHTRSSRRVFVRDIMSFLLRPIPRITGLRGDEAGVRAFTLIELLVVVLIIGILSAIALPQYQKAVEKARAAEALTVLSKISQAEAIYYLENNTLTDDMSALAVSLPVSSKYYNYQRLLFEDGHLDLLARAKDETHRLTAVVMPNGKNWLYCAPQTQSAIGLCKGLGASTCSAVEQMCSLPDFDRR